MGISQNWRLKRQRLSLVGEICPTCGVSDFPPRDIGKCGHSIGSVTHDEALKRTRALAETAEQMSGAEDYWLYVLEETKAERSAVNYPEWVEANGWRK